jgi:DNA-binding MarR family transcriptional regulator
MSPLPVIPYGSNDGLGVLIGSVRAELVRTLEADLAASGVGLRFTQFLVLKRLAALGPMSATELARAVDLDGGAMTRLLDQLETKGYLRRHPHEQDRRALRIELTEPGEALWKHMDDCNTQTLARAQRDLDDDERERLRDYLERVLSTLREKD